MYCREQKIKWLLLDELPTVLYYACFDCFAVVLGRLNVDYSMNYSTILVHVLKRTKWTVGEACWFVSMMWVACGLVAFLNHQNNEISRGIHGRGRTSSDCGPARRDCIY
jgi:hypothetical protein